MKCTIWIEKENGKLDGIFVHSDGGSCGAGKKLLENWSSTDLVESLISLGHLARVGKSLEDCISYSRDRGQLLAYYRDYPVESAKMVDARKGLCLASKKKCLDSRVLNERPSA